MHLWGHSVCVQAMSMDGHWDGVSCDCLWAVLSCPVTIQYDVSMTLWDCVQCICAWFHGTVSCSKLSRDHPRSWDCELFQDVQRLSKITGLWIISRCPETIQDHGTVNRFKMSRDHPRSRDCEPFQDHGTVNRFKMSSDQLNLIWKKNGHGNGMDTEME